MTNSSATFSSLDDNTNLFAFKIDLKDKIGNTIFLKVIQGLHDDDKIALLLETAQQFKE